MVGIGMISYRQADLIDKIKIPLRIGDKVRVNPSILGELPLIHRIFYKDNIGVVKEIRDNEFVRVWWRDNVATKDNSSNFKDTNLERVFK